MDIRPQPRELHRENQGHTLLWAEGGVQHPTAIPLFGVNPSRVTPGSGPGVTFPQSHKKISPTVALRDHSQSFYPLYPNRGEKAQHNQAQMGQLCRAKLLDFRPGFCFTVIYHMPGTPTHPLLEMLHLAQPVLPAQAGARPARMVTHTASHVPSEKENPL